MTQPDAAIPSADLAELRALPEEDRNKVWMDKDGDVWQYLKGDDPDRIRVDQPGWYVVGDNRPRAWQTLTYLMPLTQLVRLDALTAAERERERTREQLADALMWVPEHAQKALREQWKRRATDPYAGPLCRCGHADRCHQVEIDPGHWSPPIHECVACDDCRHYSPREDAHV